jgi:hypothetical protein
MRGLCFVAFLVLSMVAAAPQPAKAAEVIANIVSAAPNFEANGRSLKTGSVILEHARLSTSGSGRGEVVFIDGTKLALGPSSKLTITKSLMRGRNKFSKLGITASRGAFRWISGSSGSSSYTLSTPISTMGIRGTVLDFTVRGGKTYVALLAGRAKICGGGGCQELRRTCDYVEVGGKITKTKQISAGFKSRNAAANVFPFMANPRALSARFRVGGSQCLSAVKFSENQVLPRPTVVAPTPPPSLPPAPPSPPPSSPSKGKCDGNCGKGKGKGGGNGTGDEGRGNN